MINRILIKLPALIILLFLISTGISSAMDKRGCMTCHKYPGLVKFKKPDMVKVLHVDEAKQLASPHGKTDCKECHPKTVQIPHTDVTDVECTTKCHAKDKEKIDTIDRAYLTDFHKEERFAITRLDDETSCRVCHPLYPHSEHNKVRALLNMHTGFMLCEVCHLKKDTLENLTYDWKEPEEFEYTGEPYGTVKKKESAKKDKSGSVISKMLKMFSEEEKHDEAVEIKHTISRVAVYKIDANTKTILINTKDNDKAAEYMKNEKKMGGSDKEKELKFFHRDIAKKEISVACDECHSEEGIMDFYKLGFGKKKAKDLQFLNIKGLVTKYDTFYIPNLFGPRE